MNSVENNTSLQALIAPLKPVARLHSRSAPAPCAQPASRLWLAIHLPRFTLDMATRGNTEPQACVLVDGQGTRQRVTLVNAEAARLGIRIGMPLGAAHALGEVLPFMRVPAAEQHALAQLCAWAYQFTPMVVPVAPDALVMEVRGSLALFGGLAGLLARLRRELRQLGFNALAFGSAPTPIAAIWLARARHSTPVETLAALPAALSQVPIEVLNLTPKLQQDFCGIGVRTLGDCLRLPRESLARRFAPALLLELDRALGRQPDPRPAFKLPQVFSSRIDFLWEIHHVQALNIAMERLLNELAGILRAQVASVRGFHWRLYHADGSSSDYPLTLVEPSADALHLLRLSREHFLRRSLASPVRGICLEAADFEHRPANPSGDLFAGRQGSQGGTETWPRFVERLRARLGGKALQQLTAFPDHRPERAGDTQTFDGTRVQRAAASGPESSPRWRERPLWLTRQPLPLPECDGRPNLDGPLHLDGERERIHSGWWDGAEVARDYFIAHNQHGTRLWVFRELASPRGWYLHGIFE